MSDGYRDCGAVIITSGYPTTTIPDLTSTYCIVVAPSDGVAAQYSYTSRDFVGGMEGALYRVEPDGSAVETVYQVDIGGRVSSTTNICIDLSGPLDRGAPWKPTCRTSADQRRGDMRYLSTTALPTITAGS